MLRKISPPLHFLQCWMRCGREQNIGGLSDRDSSRALHFASGSCASFLVPTKSLYIDGIPSEPCQEKKE